MTAVIIFGAICLIFLFYNFTTANNQDIGKIKAQGGLESKYPTLIQYFMSLSPYMKVLAKDDRSITIGYRLVDGSKSNFFIHYSFNTLVIKWSFNSPMTGNLNNSWEFKQGYSVNAIISEIDMKISNMANSKLNIDFDPIPEQDIKLHNLRKLYLDFEADFSVHEKSSAGTRDMYGSTRVIANWKDSAKRKFLRHNYKLTQIDVDNAIQDYANMKQKEMNY